MGQSDDGNSSVEVPSFQTTLYCAKLTVKLRQHTWLASLEALVECILEGTFLLSGKKDLLSPELVSVLWVQLSAENWQSSPDTKALLPVFEHHTGEPGIPHSYNHFRRVQKFREAHFWVCKNVFL